MNGQDNPAAKITIDTLHFNYTLSGIATFNPKRPHITSGVNEVALHKINQDIDTYFYTDSAKI
jgi:hypothetical protein